MKANETLLLDKTRAVEERDANRRLEIYHPEVEFYLAAGAAGLRRRTGVARFST
jgi:hypothetical protein